MDLHTAAKKKYAELIAPYEKARADRGLAGKVKRRHRRHVWKQALNQANRELPPVPKPKKQRLRRQPKRYRFLGGRMMEQRADAFEANVMKLHRTKEQAVVKAIEEGYNGPLPEDIDDDRVEAEAKRQGKQGFFAKLWGMRKLFG